MDSGMFSWAAASRIRQQEDATTQKVSRLLSDGIPSRVSFRLFLAVYFLRKSYGSNVMDSVGMGTPYFPDLLKVVLALP